MRLTPPTRSRAVAILVTAAVAGTVGAGVGAVATRGALTTGARSTATIITPQAAGVASPRPRAVSRAVRPAFTPRPAWVRVSVATIWVGPHKPRRIDRPVLSTHPDVHAWLRRQSLAQRLGLIDRVMTQALLGDRVVVLEQRAEWDRVRLVSQRGSAFPDGIVGWVPRRQLTLEAPAVGAALGTVVVARVHVRAPSAHTEVPASDGTQLPVVSRGPRTVAVTLPGVGPAVLPASAVVVGRKPSGTAALRAARRFMGVPYLWGGTSAWGIDCSGLTYLAFREMSIRLARDAADQSQHGRRVKRRNLRPGDLVFFGPGNWHTIHHVGIYAGHGMLLHAPHTGSHVMLTPLSKFPDYWGARRYA